MKKSASLRENGKNAGSGRAVGLIALLAGAALAAVGLWQGQYASVLAKAVRICMECIGIG